MPSGTKPTDPGATDPTTPGGTPTPGTPTPGRSVDPFTPTTPPKPTEKPGSTTTGPGESSSFGTPRESQIPTLERSGATPKPADATGETGTTGESSAFGPDTTASKPKVAPPSYTLPGFFGGGSTTYTGGQGRLARPRFRYTVTTSQGFDDNVLQTPDEEQRFPDQVVLIDPGAPETVTFVPVTTTRFEKGFAGGLVVDIPVTTTTIQRVVTPGRDPVFQTIRSPEPQKRTGSLISRAGLKIDVQKFTRRSLLTVDLNAQVDHYWNRPGSDGKDDYSGSFAMNYLYNLTPRLQASVSTNLAYLSQPDISRVNTPDRLGAGDIVNALARLNLQYRLTPRLTGTLSVGQNALIYVDKTAAATALPSVNTNSRNGDNFETTISAEARYLWKPRYTLLAELRHVIINYPDTPSVNATTDLLLLGAEMRLSSRITATVRLGEAIRIFDETGQSSSAPYGEAALTYRLSPTSSVQWNSRFGFEEPPSADSEVLGYRTTLNYFKNFTPRLSLSAGITGVVRNTSSSGGGSDLTQQTVDANAGLQYRLNRQLTLTANFSFTKLIASGGTQDYDRSRIFVGAEYEF